MSTSSSPWRPWPTGAPPRCPAQKLKKANDTDTPTLQFVQNPDILAAVAARADAPCCVGFAAESENLEQYGEQKRQRKGVPLLVGNIGHHTFGMDDNEIVLFDAGGA